MIGSSICEVYLCSLSLQFTFSYAISIGMNDKPTPRPALSALVAEDLRSAVSKIKRRMREQADVGDLTPTQASVLVRLEKDGPMTTSNLARAEAMRPQSMGAVVAALEAAGLVSGTADPKDGRQTILAITETCRTWIQDGRAARQDWLSRTIEARLSDEEQAQLLSAARLLLRLAED
jgi:DNA-binding MarR family transcriptional regulator